MGLLDTDAMKLLFGGSQYMKDRELARQGQRYAQMVGTPNTPQVNYGGLMQPQTETTANGVTTITGGEQMPGDRTVEMGGGTGLLGGQMTRPQFNAAIGQLPGYRAMSATLQSQDMSNDAAMARQQQGQQYNSNHLSYAQALAQQNAVRGQVEGLQTKFNKATEPYQASIRGATVMDTIFPDEKSYETASGSTQLAGIMRFMKQQNDGGAFMSDDMQNIARANGVSGTIADMWNWFTGNGFKSPVVMKDLHETMRKQAIADSQKITEQAKSLHDAIPWAQQYMPQITRGSGMGYAAPTKMQKPKSGLTPY